MEVRKSVSKLGAIQVPVSFYARRLYCNLSLKLFCRWKFSSGRLIFNFRPNE